jgi:hypothetical protein
MSNPSGPDHEPTPAPEPSAPADEQDFAATAPQAAADAEPATVVMDPTAVADPETDPRMEVLTEEPAPQTEEQPAERRFTAPSGFDGSTQKIDPPPDPETEVISVPDKPVAAPKTAGPQLIPPRADAPRPPRQRRSWGWVAALLLVIAALVAVAVLGTVLLTRGGGPKVSQEDKVRSTIHTFDVAVQNGDLATLRGITCGATRDSYVGYDERAWSETHARVAAAKQYPVVASIDQVVVNGNHAEANVTTFMAFAPETRSTRSFDLQFIDEQWKVCQAG